MAYILQSFRYQILNLTIKVLMMLFGKNDSQEGKRMKLIKHYWKSSLVTMALLLVLPLTGLADENYDQLKQQVEALQQQLDQVRQIMKEYADQSVSKIEVAKEVSVLKQDIAQASEWKTPSTLIHLAGYADVGYSNGENVDGSFAVGSFSPIFHYQYRDMVMLEAELEIEVEDNGDTEVALEYLTIDYFINDYMTLVGGKFLSPIGNFRQNLHPSWINKLASAPPDFGHDGAAPTSDVGVQLRGGFPVAGTFANYAAYVSNGPELNAEFEDDEFSLEGIVAEGFGSNSDGELVVGGRIGFFPFPGLEVGLSAATGKATVTAIELAHHDIGEGADHDDEGEVADHDDEGEVADHDDEGEVADHDDEGEVADHEEGEEGEETVFDLSNEYARDYDVFGADFSWGLGNLRLRGEYVKSKVGKATSGVTASEGATWKSWYAQTSYLIPQTKWEPVLRYTDFDSPHSNQDQQQWGLGLNYLFTNSAIAKFTYEFNDGQNGTAADNDRFLIQFAYGF
jgi:hypothetical protein